MSIFDSSPFSIHKLRKVTGMINHVIPWHNESSLEELRAGTRRLAPLFGMGLTALVLCFMQTK